MLTPRNLAWCDKPEYSKKTTSLGQAATILPRDNISNQTWNTAAASESFTTALSMSSVWKWEKVGGHSLVQFRCHGNKVLCQGCQNLQWMECFYVKICMCNNEPVKLIRNVSGTYNWASSRENLSSGFATKVDSNRPAQPQKLGRGLKFRI